MLLPWSCQSQSSVIRVCKDICRDLVEGFPRYCPGHGRAHRQLSESAHIVAVVISVASHAVAQIMSWPPINCQSLHIYLLWYLSGLTVEYQNLAMCFTDCYSTHDFRNIDARNEISQFSINCISIINHPTNIYYIHEQLDGLVVDYRLQIPPSGSRGFPISTIDCIDPVHMYSQDHFLYLWWDTFPLFK
jgi:hypothetical protein